MSIDSRPGFVRAGPAYWQLIVNTRVIGSVSTGHFNIYVVTYGIKNELCPFLIKYPIAQIQVPDVYIFSWYLKKCLEYNKAYNIC